MKLKAFNSDNFAGLKDINVEFEPGLNVVLGPNESGKSSLVEAMYSTLFVDTKLRQSTILGREFLFRFMPRPGGDSIDGSVSFETDQGAYKLEKEWGSQENLVLTGPDGIKIRNQGQVRDRLNSLLTYGESTYENLVFAKQRDMKNALGRILSHPELTKEIKDVLHMAVMELGGISVDEIERRLQEEISKLYGRWDKDKKLPEKNRGISNPWQTGTGLIVESYYKKDQLKLDMEKAQAAELAFEKISEEFKEQEEEYQASAKEKEDLEAIEDGVNQRAIINLKLEGIANEEKALLEANDDWPKIEIELLQNQEKLMGLEKEKDQIKLKQDKQKDYQKVQDLRTRLEKLDEIAAKKKAKEKEAAGLAKVEQDHVDRLAELNRLLAKLEAGLKAGELEVSIKSDEDKAIFISKDLEDRSPIDDKDKLTALKASSYLKIEYGQELEIEIKAQALDFEKIKAQYKESKEEVQGILKDLKLESEEEVRSALAKRKEIGGEIDLLSKEEKLILKGDKREGIEKTLKDTGEDKLTESPQDLEDAYKKIIEEEIDVKSRIKSSQDKISVWLDKYENKGNLLILLAEKLNDKKDLMKDLDQLVALPEEFKSTEDFNSRLRELRASLSQGLEKLNKLREEYYQARNDLMDEAAEDYRLAYGLALEDFEAKLHKGEKYQLIEKAFYETKDRMTQNPMEPLVEEFSRLISDLTLGRYTRGQIQEDFNLTLNKNGPAGLELPLDLLSAGTYDVVALALRFALMKHFFKDGKTFMVLDDSLVDMDPERKNQAAKMIRDFAKDYQIIFTTCHPDTADLLGGNRINL